MPVPENTTDSDVIVSVVIPCYNQGEYILDALSSVQTCNEPVYEVIIVNDGSTEPLTLKVLSYLKEKGYVVIDQDNQGLSEARNNGIKAAKGRYILPLDADNKIRLNYIPRGIEILDKYPEVGVVYGNAELFGDKTGVWEFPDFDVNRIIMGNFIDACAVIRKSLWENCGGYDSKIPDKLGYEDWDLWLGATEKGWQFYHVPEVLFDYRFRENSMVSRCNVPENRRQLIRYIYSKHIGLFATNFINVAAEKEYAFLSQQAYIEGWKLKCDNLEKDKSDLIEVQTKLQEEHSQKLQELQIYHQQKETELQEQLQGFQRTLEEKQLELVELRNILQETQKIYQQSQVEYARIQEEYERLNHDVHQMRSQLQETKTRLEGTELELAHKKAEAEQSKNLIIAMQTSKFWKLRSSWFKVKKMIGVDSDV